VVTASPSASTLWISMRASASARTTLWARAHGRGDGISVEANMRQGTMRPSVTTCQQGCQCDVPVKYCDVAQALGICVGEGMGDGEGNAKEGEGGVKKYL
jgi:hypothetical protein